MFQINVPMLDGSTFPRTSGSHFRLNLPSELTLHNGSGNRPAADAIIGRTTWELYKSKTIDSVDQEIVSVNQTKMTWSVEIAEYCSERKKKKRRQEGSGVTLHSNS